MKRLDKVIVVDSESTCWDDFPPEKEIGEIIEIGICVIDVDRLEISDSNRIIVKPQNSKVSPYCTRLTGLRQEDVDRGILFPDACREILARHDTRKYPWISYGDYDRVQFGRMCRPNLYKTAPYPFGPRHINIKTMLALALGWTEEASVVQGCRALGIKIEGRTHRALDDAKNVASVFLKILRLIQTGLKVERDGTGA